MAVSNQTVVAVMSDLHWGKKTRDYNTKSAAEVLLDFDDKLAEIKEGVGKGADKLVVVMNGDMIDGTGIYPTQAHHQDGTDVTEQIEECGSVLSNVLISMRHTWGNVEVVTAPGNHGRTSKHNNEASNYDRILYKQLRDATKSAGVKFKAEDPKVGPFLQPFTVRGHSMLLNHGHTISMYQGVPFYGIKQRVTQWKADEFKDLDVVIFGHFHSFGLWDMNGSTVVLNGTPVKKDLWALETFGGTSANKWLVFGVTDEDKMAWTVPVSV